MTEIAELERRITAALDRIGTGLDGMGGDGDDVALQELRDALDAEKTVNAQLDERVKTLHEQHDTRVRELEADVAKLKTSALEANGQVQSMRRANQHLQATLQNLREAAATGVEPHLINQAMMSELEGLRSVRDADRSELDDILGALQPLLKEAQDA